MTTTDSNGIVFLETTDNISPFHTLINTLQTGTSTAITGIKNTTNAAWTSYTPSATAGMTLGNGVPTGAYKRIGSIMYVRGRIILGSTSSVTGSIRVSVPTAPLLADSIMPLGVVVLYDSSTGLRMTAHARFYSGTEVEILAPDGGTARVGAPWTWATGDGIAWSLAYEVA